MKTAFVIEIKSFWFSHLYRGTLHNLVFRFLHNLTFGREGVSEKNYRALIFLNSHNPLSSVNPK